jgi:uncharacterized protein
MSDADFGDAVRTMDELRALVAAPAQLVVDKEIDHVDDHVHAFIGASPFLVCATRDALGRSDASPRGGEPGFVKVLDARRLLILEATGNRRADTLSNLVGDPGIGLIFLVPGYDETIRVKGVATITRDAELLVRHAGDGPTPPLGIGIRVESCFVHCAKAAMRSSLWNPIDWPDPGALPTPAEMLRDHTSRSFGDGSATAMQAALRESYLKRL